MEDSRKKKIAVYCRVATADQLGLKCQEEKMRAYVAKHPEWELVKVFTDTCPTARLSQRHGLAGLIHGARNKEYSLVVIPSASRLARGTYYHHILLEKLQKEGLRVHYADGIEPYELDGFMQFLIRQGV